MSPLESFVVSVQTTCTLPFDSTAMAGAVESPVFPETLMKVGPGSDIAFGALFP